MIKVETPGGAGWYRYNHDAYGERADGGNYDGRTGVGRLWTLLTGERGEYDVARGDLVSARKRLDAMMAFANDGMMIPEQVWDRQESPRPELRFGEGTGSATPLAWSMAQFIRLAINIKQGHNVETPKATATRYLKGSTKKLTVSATNKLDRARLSLSSLPISAARTFAWPPSIETGRFHCRQMQSTPQAEKPNEIVRALIDAVHDCEATAGGTGRRDFRGVGSCPGNGERRRRRRR